MSTVQSTLAPRIAARRNNETGHLLRVRAVGLACFLALAALALYGADYYLLPVTERPFSVKHELLKPSGTIGIKLGIVGTVLFVIIFLYAVRKVVPWLGRIGNARHWMDFHVIAGMTAPVVIAFHASFKFNGIAGIAFWIMLAVAFSGIVGRYLYAQIPRSVTAAELSMSELMASEEEMRQTLARQNVYSEAQLRRVLTTPTAEHIRRIGPLLALAEMIVLDMRLPFQMAALRRSAPNSGGVLRTAFGILPGSSPEVERVVRLVRQKAAHSRKLIFLSHTQKVFHLWHVVHRPFSYAFVVLALLHIAVVTGLGFF